MQSRTSELNQRLQEVPLHFGPEAIRLSWEAIETLCWKIRREWQAACYQPNYILALGKGAMIPSRLLAREGVQVFYSGVRSYEEREHASLSVYQCVTGGDYTGAEFLNTPETLIVDDLWDTGATFQYAKGVWPKARTAALLCKCPREETKLDFVGISLPMKTWIQFPWE